MLLTVSQTAEKLGVGRDRVRTLTTEGLLVDESGKAGAGRHMCLYDSRAVQKLASQPDVYAPRGRHNRNGRNGHASLPIAEPVQAKLSVSPLARMEALATTLEASVRRLEALEKLITDVVALWS